MTSNDQQLELIRNHCQIRRARFSALVQVRGSRARLALLSSVPKHGREREAGVNVWRVYSSHLGRLTTAMKAADVDVDDGPSEGAA